MITDNINMGIISQPPITTISHRFIPALFAWHLAFRSLLGGRAGALCLCLPEDFSTHLAVRSALPGPGREKNIPDAAGASGII